MTRTTQQDHETSVLLEFAHSSGWTMNALDVQTRSPPEPDILWCNEREKRYFELVRLTSIMAESVRTLMRGRQPRPLMTTKFKFQEKEALLSKFKKRYELYGAPVSLLAYWDWDRSDPATATDIAAPSAELWLEWHAPTLQTLIETEQHPFTSIHFFRRRIQSVLWSWARTG